MKERKVPIFNYKKVSIPAYRKAKLKMLKRDFCITLTADELAHAETLTTEAQIDQFYVMILNKRWR